MSSRNNHSTAIPAEVFREAQDLAEQLYRILQRYFTSLTPSERQTLAKMGDKTLAFVEKAHELAVTNPTLVPQYINMGDFDADFADAHNIEPLRIAVEQIFSGIDDTKMLAGNEAYHHALVFYNSAKAAAEQNINGAKTVYDALKVRFPTRRRRKDVEE